MLIMSNTLSGQSLHDIAIQETGNPDNAFELAVRNDMSVTESVIAGSTLSIPEEVEREKSVLNYYKLRGLKPATEGVNSSTARGINFWSIGVDFLVS